MTDTDYSNRFFKANSDIPVLDAMPEGWGIVRGAMTAPRGYAWINNRKSIFSDEYRHALLRKINPSKRERQCRN